MKRLRQLRSLPPDERALLLEAFGLLWLARLGLWLLPARTLRRRLASAGPPSGGGLSAGAAGDRVAWALSVTGRYVPRSTCLTRAVAAQALLRRRGVPARLRIGVARGERRLEAHAWVEGPGGIVVGAEDPARYTTLHRPGE